ncbi:hypothetical protein [Shewanella sedimentimangrovi]|uniref:Porin n=1 Tax=Shewanella sedimentimangrovi TaxID=2814293 RepID=A0ABX7R1T6_9GAMM|nr:hypothetical protein [Shewanella sedimentimangrovi]QSX37743.1 hypothetical protein JYB85_02555 [Shewanella sedimentimangrovi]
MRYIRGFVLVTGMLSSLALAQDWQWNGFISQGLVGVDGSHFFTDDDTSLELTEATLMSSWRPAEHWRLAGALNYRQRGNLIDEAWQMDYLFVEYLHFLASGHMGVRLGRVKNEVGLYSSTRDVPFSRPGIIMPQSIYSDYYRDAQLHIDGLDIFGQYHLDDGQLNWHLTGGSADATKDLTRNVNGTLAYGQYHSDAFVSLDLDLQYQDWTLGATLFHVGLGFETEPKTFESHVDLRALVLSAQYRAGPLELTAEFMQGNRYLKGIFSSGGERREPYRGYYLDLHSRFASPVNVFARFDHMINNLDDRNGARLERATGIPAHYGYSKDWVAGVQWQLADNWLLVAEHHWIEGAAWVPPVIFPQPLTQDKYWSIFALQLSYRMQW